MCVIIHQQKDKRQVTYEEFESSWQSNPHGFWLIYFNNNKVCIEKSMRMKEAWAIYNNLASELEWETDFILHFRYSTHWSIGLDNCHPFPCGNGKYLVHNGVLGYSSTNPWEEDFSDTKLLALTLEKFDVNPNDNWLYNQVVCDFVNSICTWDKILVMDTDGQVYRFGKEGIESPCGQLWASNDSPFDMYGYHKFYGSCNTVEVDEEWHDLSQGFYEDGVWISNEEYCNRYGIPYVASEWE